MAGIRWHLRLEEIAPSSVDVKYNALLNHVTMWLRSVYIVTTIWSGGNAWCSGANPVIKAKVGARLVARCIAKCCFGCRLSKYNVLDIMATCYLPFRGLS